MKTMHIVIKNIQNLIWGSEGHIPSFWSNNNGSRLFCLFRMICQHEKVAITENKQFGAGNNEICAILPVIFVKKGLGINLIRKFMGKIRNET
ncbi:MAG: hypothetical protein MJA29_05910, partial [Candidatus Omnitrophica bacterium]|nr:hypothetical protein [Candidatus Omnitrophota bacterium]